MGMLFPNPDLSQHRHYSRVNWQGQPDAAEVSISISADSLCRLLQSRQLHVEDLTCLDAASKAQVRKILLNLAC